MAKKQNITAGDEVTILSPGTIADGEYLRNDSGSLEGSPVNVAVNYVQATTPSSPSSGEMWYDNSSGIFRVYADLGSGADWHPIPPVQVLEEASTFAESDVSVTHNNTEVLDGSIGFQPGSTTSRESDDAALSGVSDGRGLVINPNNDLGGVEVTLSSNTGTVQDVFIADTNENILAEKTAGYSSGDTERLYASLSSGTKYYVGVYNDGTSYEAGDDTDPTYDYTGTDLDIVDGVRRAHPDDGSSAIIESGFAFTIIDVTALGIYSSGDALVEWDSAVPTDIKSWDLATFQRTLDGETVTVDVEDAAGNVLFSDIEQNFDISTVDTHKEVKLRANLSRNDTANNPTVDYLARRFTR